jgi:hypothetical protein
MAHVSSDATAAQRQADGLAYEAISQQKTLSLFEDAASSHAGAEDL